MYYRKTEFTPHPRANLEVIVSKLNNSDLTPHIHASAPSRSYKIHLQEITERDPNNPIAKRY